MAARSALHLHRSDPAGRRHHGHSQCRGPHRLRHHPRQHAHGRRRYGGNQAAVALAAHHPVDRDPRPVSALRRQFHRPGVPDGRLLRADGHGAQSRGRPRGIARSRLRRLLRGRRLYDGAVHGRQRVLARPELRLGMGEPVLLGGDAARDPRFRHRRHPVRRAGAQGARRLSGGRDAGLGRDRAHHRAFGRGLALARRRQGRAADPAGHLCSATSSTIRSRCSTSSSSARCSPPTSPGGWRTRGSAAPGRRSGTTRTWRRRSASTSST